MSDDLPPELLDFLDSFDDQRPRYYDRDGNPLRLMEWGRLFEDHEYKRIDATDLWNGGWVSTVWLGLDHNYLGGPPLIFETMVFFWFGATDLDCQRYTTEAQARAGHAEMVAKWRRPGVFIRALPSVFRSALRRRYWEVLWWLERRRPRFTLNKPADPADSDAAAPAPTDPPQEDQEPR